MKKEAEGWIRIAVEEFSVSKISFGKVVIQNGLLSLTAGG